MSFERPAVVAAATVARLVHLNFSFHELLLKNDRSTVRTREDQLTEGVGVTRPPLSLYPLFLLGQGLFLSCVLTGDASGGDIMSETVVDSAVAETISKLACGIEVRDDFFLID